MIPPTTTVLILRVATGRISDPTKWCKAYYRNDAQACAAGAIWYGATGDEAVGMVPPGLDPAPILGAFRAVLRAAWEPLPRSMNVYEAEEAVIAWNDARDRVHAHVESAFRRALAAEEMKA